MLNFLYKLLYDIFFFQIKMTMYVRVLFIGQYFPLHSFIHVQLITSLSVRRRSDGIEPHLLAAIMQLSTLQLSIFKSEKERKRQKKIGEHACADLRGGGGLQICLGPDDYSLVYTAQHVPFASTAKHSALRSRHRSYVHVYNVICNTNIAFTL